MDLDPASLLVSFVVSSAGFVAFMYGKKQSRMPHLAFGLVLMVFPYFVSSTLAVALIGALLLAGLWAAARVA